MRAPRLSGIGRIGLRRRPVDERHVARADDFVERRFRFIDGSVEDLNQEITLPWVVERAEEIRPSWLIWRRRMAGRVEGVGP